MKRRMLTAAAAALSLTLVVTGCGSSNNEGGNNAVNASAEASGGNAKAGGEVTKIVVGTGTEFPQICFIDENGKLTGFDVELVREIDERLAAYEFEFQTMEFSNLLLSLETKKIDFVAHEMEKNPEREQKYLFNKVPYAHWRNRIIVAKDNDSVQTLDDLAGKKAITSPTSAGNQILENYNKDHDKKIEIVYEGSAANDSINQIASGRVDATIGADFALALEDPQKKLKTVGEPLSEADILFIFRKDEPEAQKLADAIDGALTEIKSDGTLGKLSEEWLGSDFTADTVK